MRKVIAICIVCMFYTVPAWAVVEIEGFYWFMEIEGNVSAGIGGIEGMKVDLKDDFGYGDTINVPGVRLIIGETHQFGFSVLKFDASAGKTIDRIISFKDLEFTINEYISTSIDLTALKGFYRFNIGPEVFHGGLILGGEYFSIKAEVASARLGTAKADVDTSLLLFGGFVESEPFSFLRIRASLVGGSWDIGDAEANYLEFEVSVLAQIPPGFYVGAGYSQIDIDAKHSNLPIEVDLTFKGPTVFIGFEW